jgi:hypothetical protein
MAEPAPHGCDHEGPGEIATRRAGHRADQSIGTEIGTGARRAVTEPPTDRHHVEPSRDQGRASLSAEDRVTP